MQILYFLIALASTTVGALTGMGGGVIIKPICDVLGHYDAATIGVLSCGTVFAMSIVSIGKQIRQKAHIDPKMAVPTGIGSVIGGSVGQHILSAIIASLGNNQKVVMVQNICLGLLIVLVFLYMVCKSKIPTLHLSGVLPSALAGILLGFFSSFLGIGGGPINVAVIMFLFSYDIKSATVASIITIFFAQIAKLASILLAGGFAGYDLRVLPLMIAGAVAGGFLGAKLNKQLSDRTVERAFNCVQLVVLAICVMNIVRNR